jgi:hypothetical protein
MPWARGDSQRIGKSNRALTNLVLWTNIGEDCLAELTTFAADDERKIS